jgi:hypothetical protein
VFNWDGTVKEADVEQLLKQQRPKANVENRKPTRGGGRKRRRGRPAKNVVLPRHPQAFIFLYFLIGFAFYFFIYIIS